MRFEALLDALRELFGPRLSFREGGDGGVVVLSDGGVACCVGLVEGGLESVAWQLLGMAQDIWLRGLGEEGTHPGAWATASPEVRREGAELVLTLRGAQGELASARVPLVP